MHSTPKPVDHAVKPIFDAYPSKRRADLLRLRALILDTASQTDHVGALVETLKWGQPSYHPAKPRVGTTIRIDVMKDDPRHYAMFVPCQTTLIDTFRLLYPDRFDYRGNRALVFEHGKPLPEEELRHCVRLSLTYHRKAARQVSG